MKTLCLLALIIGSNVTLALADTTQFIALTTTGTTNAYYPVATNAAVACVGSTSSGTSYGYGTLPGGQTVRLFIGQTFSGFTNVLVQNQGGGFVYTCIQITTPSIANTGTVTNCYLPANALVIPTSVTGPVVLGIETSSDLTTWTSCNPGTYGPNLGQQRFFRLVALAQ